MLIKRLPAKMQHGQYQNIGILYNLENVSALHHRTIPQEFLASQSHRPQQLRAFSYMQLLVFEDHIRFQQVLK